MQNIFSFFFFFLMTQEVVLRQKTVFLASGHAIASLHTGLCSLSSGNSLWGRQDRDLLGQPVVSVLLQSLAEHCKVIFIFKKGSVGNSSWLSHAGVKERWITPIVLRQKENHSIAIWGEKGYFILIIKILLKILLICKCEWKDFDPFLSMIAHTWWCCLHFSHFVRHKKIRWVPRGRVILFSSQCVRRERLPCVDEIITLLAAIYLWMLSGGKHNYHF